MGSSLTGSSPSTQVLSTLNPEQQQLFGQLGTVLGGQIGQGAPITASPVQQEAYNTATSATNSMNGLAQDVYGNQNTLEALSGDTGQLAGTIPGMQAALDPLKSNVSSLLTGLGPSMKPYNAGQTSQQFGAQVAAPAWNNFTQNVAPAITEQFAGYGAANSGGEKAALANAGSNLASNLSGQQSQFTQNAQQQAISNLLSGTSASNSLIGQNASLTGEQGTLAQLQNGILGAAGNLRSSSTSADNTLSNIFGNITGTGLSAGNSQFNTTQASQPWNNPWLTQFLMPMLQDQTQTAVTTPGQQDGMGGILSGIGSLAPLIAAAAF